MSLTHTLEAALNWRYAVKQFSDKKISASQLTCLLEATRLSASSYGLQPYKILLIESKALRQQLLEHSYGQDKIAHSSHLIVFAVDLEIGDATVERYIQKHAQISGVCVSQLADFSAHMKGALSAKTAVQRQEWAHQQAYIALGNLLTSAALLQIDSCPMSGIDNAGYDKVLGLAEKGLTTSMICPIGYRHSDDQQARSDKVRFDYDEIVWEL